jgi:hypothetical protein
MPKKSNIKYLKTEVVCYNKKDHRPQTKHIIPFGAAQWTYGSGQQIAREINQKQNLTVS